MNDKNNCRIDIVTESGKNIYYINSRAHDWLILNIKLTVCLGQLYKIVQYFVQFHDLHHCGQSVYWISFLHRLYWNKEMMNTICRYKYHRHSSIHQFYLLEDNYNLYSLGSRYSLPAWTCLPPGCSETPLWDLSPLWFTWSHLLTKRPQSIHHSCKPKHFCWITR